MCEQVKFFNGVEASELVRHRDKFHQILQQLNQLCSRPSLVATGHGKMDCCLMSYSTPCGKAYQIVDTQLSLAFQ